MNSGEVLPTQPIVVDPAVAPATHPWGAAASPWARVPAAVPQSFEEVMSEELAQQLEMEDSKTPSSQIEPEIDLSLFVDQHFPDTSNDAVLAQMMQREFDKEQDQLLKRKENQLNGNSKVRMSYDRYRLANPDGEEDLEDGEEPWEDDDSPDPVPNFSKRGTAGKGKDMVSKHDAVICGRRNARNVMDQLELATGDGGSFDMRLSNKVYNELKKHSESQNKRSARVHEKKEHSTAEKAMDEKTRLALYKLVNNEVLDSVNGVISSGKESVVYHANGGENKDYWIPDECAVKIFKTTLQDFKNRAIYVKGDIRFFKDQFKKQNPRRIMKLWAAKEEYNLKRLEKYGVPCPRVVRRKKHVLIMSFIGQNHQAAPKLKNAKLSTADMQMAYEQCILYAKRMYQQAGLVHADLSEYNLLWQDQRLYVIDVGQAVDRGHPLAHEFLLRDCHNVCEFFTKAGIPKVPTQYELFNDITSLNLKGHAKDFLAQIEEYEKSEERLRSDTGKDYPFEFFYDKAAKEREDQSWLPEDGDSSSSEDSDDDTWEQIHDSSVPSAIMTSGSKSTITEEKVASSEDSDVGGWEKVKSSVEEKNPQNLADKKDSDVTIAVAADVSCSEDSDEGWEMVKSSKHKGKKSRGKPDGSAGHTDSSNNPDAQSAK